MVTIAPLLKGHVLMLSSQRPQPISSPLLDQACSNTMIRHGFFTRKGGVSQGIYSSLNVGVGSEDEPGSISENRSRVVAAFGAPLARLATVHQIHSADVFVVDEHYEGARPKADALVTNVPGIVLGVLSADCGPILFADPKAGIVGAAHAGWRGALDGIAEATIAAMEKLGARRQDIVAALGPSISGVNYEVGAEFTERFTAQDAANARYFGPSTRAGHAMFDLPAYTIDRLVSAGVKAHWTGHCTYADDALFFSYRRTTHRNEADYGRQIAAISITE
jgi:polyphenol oxidase